MDGGGDAGDDIGAFGEDLFLEREEVVVHVEDIRVSDGPGVDLLPECSDAGEGCNECDVFVFGASHGSACFSGGDIDAASMEDFLEDLSGAAAAVVDGCAGPVEDDGFDLGEVGHVVAFRDYWSWFQKSSASPKAMVIPAPPVPVKRCIPGKGVDWKTGSEGCFA
ncbi:MAG: hypothetical protein RL215_1609 [Planctomycetota bacterium]